MTATPIHVLSTEAVTITIDSSTCMMMRRWWGGDLTAAGLALIRRGIVAMRSDEKPRLNMMNTSFMTPGSLEIHGGIYAIRNADVDRAYIGSTQCFGARLRQHKEMLLAGAHHNRALQSDWTLQRGEGFSMGILEVVADPTALLQREQAWINAWRDLAGFKRSYNVHNACAGR